MTAAVIRSGVAPFDRSLGGGLAAGRIHVLTGGLGTGKTTACLQFLDAGIQRGDRCVLLTSDRGSDLRAHAAHAGIVLDSALRDGRLVVIRYRSTFADRFTHAASPRLVLDDLQRMVGDPAPRRVAVDTIVPLLGDGSPAGGGLAALAEFLERLDATALVTYPGDLSAGSDRRFDALTNRAATVLHLERGPEGTFRLDVVSRRGAGATVPRTPYAIEAGAGIVGARQALSAGPARRLVLLHATDVASPAILELLGRDHDIAVAPLADAASLGALPGETSAAVIETDHGSLEATHAFLRQAASPADARPLIVIARFNLRSVDRARLLRAGADEVLATDMSPHELLQRLAATLSRGHLQRPAIRYSERLFTQADLGVASMEPLGRAAFAAALAAHVAHDHPTQYAVVHLAPARGSGHPGGSDAAVEELCEVVLQNARMASGDLLGLIDGRVAVYLHGARLADAEPFVARIRSAWVSRRRGPLEVEIHSYPSDEARLRTLMEASPQS